MYLAKNIWLDIDFVVNLLVRFRCCPNQRHWNGIKHVFRYLHGVIDIVLLYVNESRPQLIGYVNGGTYLIHIRLDLKQLVYLQVVIQLYYGVLQNKQLLLVFQII